MTNLSEFIETERQQYTNVHNNLFAFSLGQALRYYEFILITFQRYKEATQKMGAIHSMLMGSIKSQSDGKMSDEQMQLFNQSREQTTLVHLEIESFYLFGKIFLDKIALFIQNYFGPTRGISLISHNKLTKDYEKYRISKGLIYPEGFSDSLQSLNQHICNYRDKQISHLQGQRINKATVFDSTGHARIAAFQIYPTEQDVQVESTELSELMNAIDLYIEQVIALINMNRLKTKYTLKG